MDELYNLKRLLKAIVNDKQIVIALGETNADKLRKYITHLDTHWYPPGESLRGMHYRVSSMDGLERVTDDDVASCLDYIHEKRELSDYDMSDYIWEWAENRRAAAEDAAMEWKREQLMIP
ncbi:hypothetical protein V757_12200 [Pelistega indica]|uniref:Uncharacterized protein n=1 Tax=Pelistega indica TaxID=1414851 RepID=V8FTG6_9BURK|nr:hypothetical protein V757_12200 [Pelistega indica]